MSMLFLIGLLFHLLLTGLFFLFIRRHLPQQQAETETLYCFFVPFFGVFMLLGLHFLCWSTDREVMHDTHKLNRDAKVFSKNMRQDSEIIPLNDTIFVEDPQQKRRFFTEAIKQNMLQNQHVLQQAVHDEDREVAYYAISMLTTKLEELETRLFDEERLVREKHGPKAVKILKEYAVNLRDYIAQKFIDPMTRRQKEMRYAEIQGKLIEAEPEEQEHYREKICQDIHLQNYAAAQETCALFMERFPEGEQPYLMYIRLYQAMHEPEKLQKKIAELKALPIKLTIEAIEIIRFWDRKGAAANV